MTFNFYKLWVVCEGLEDIQCSHSHITQRGVQFVLILISTLTEVNPGIEPGTSNLNSAKDDS